MSEMGKLRNSPWVDLDHKTRVAIWDAAHQYTTVEPDPEKIARGRAFHGEYLALCAKYNAEIQVVEMDSVGVYVDDDPVLYARWGETCLITEVCTTRPKVATRYPHHGDHILVSVDRLLKEARS